MRPGILVVAKAPVAGEAKTRLAIEIGPKVAADLASAALLDTLDACERAFPRRLRTLALTGDLERAERFSELAGRLAVWGVFRQRGNGFGSRLANAHVDAAHVLRSPVVQIGMDTPHVTARQLTAISELLSDDIDAALGPAADGGWWSLALKHPRWARDLAGVPMSTSHTGEDTHAMLTRSGARVASTGQLRDIDTVADAAAVADAHPSLRFAAAWRSVASESSSATELFEEALAGATCVMHGMPGGPVELPVDSWRGACDESDRVLMGECAGPTLDVGCGPGRFTHGLAVQGTAALGIDIAPGAVRHTRARGAQAICRDVFHPLPAEGRWQSVLLADGNIGIGGDPVRLLRRIGDLMSPTGRALVELAPPGAGVTTHRVQLEVSGRRSTPFGWAVVGAECLDALARQASLRSLWLINHRGRWFAELARATARGSAR
jgi:glycosyltransferase A (GT-A) superfamily protein (DUF2064 family)/SAM-dependent methyltransferase